MSEKTHIDENEFAMGSAGYSGAVNYAAGWATPASPLVRQNPEHFANSNNNKAIGSNSNTAVNTPASQSMQNADVNQIYQKKDTPSPDEVMSGLQYEMGKMTKKDKAMAKQIVVSNLKKDPHYYGSLHMIGVTDDSLMGPIEKPSPDKVQETVKILDAMIAAKNKAKEPTPQSYLDAIKETRDKKMQRYTR